MESNNKKLEAMKNFENRIKGKQNSYSINTGLSKLDKLIGNFKGKNLIILGGRTSIGKNALMITIANHLIKAKIPIYISSLKMVSCLDILDRFLANRIGLDLFKIKNEPEKISQETLNLMEKTMETLVKDENLAIDDTPYINIDKLILKATKQYEQKPFKIWFIDNLQFIKGNEKLSRYEQVGIITKELKKFGIKYNVDIVLLSQLNREVTNRKGNRPNMEDLRESGSIKEDADIIMLLHRDDYYKEKDKNLDKDSIVKAEIIVDKNRDGAVGTAKVFFEKRYTRFINSDFTIKVKKSKEIEIEEGF